MTLWLLAQQLVNSCNDGARRMERTEQMYTIQKQMEFGKIKVRPKRASEVLGGMLGQGGADELLTVSPQPFPLVSSSRWLKKCGELAVSTEELSIWRAFSHRSYYLFLFNDVLIITKRKRSAHETQTIRATPVGAGKAGHVIEIGAVGEEF